MMQQLSTTITDYYLEARSILEGTPYADEISWQEAQDISDVTETTLLREHAWVVLNSGFREETVRKHFDYLSLCFCDWASANEILEHSEACYESAFAAFGSRRKLSAIIEMSKIVSEQGLDTLVNAIKSDPITTLVSLPYIGNVTAWHLAKNLGIDVAKPDRHLVRLAERFGYSCVHYMCGEINEAVGDKVSVVDLVLWRFEEQTTAATKRLRQNSPQ